MAEKEEKKAEGEAKKESKGGRRYNHGPKISAKPKGEKSEGEETTSEEKETGSAAPKADVTSGTDGIAVTARHAAERGALHHNHMREHHDLHAKHQAEHATHKGDKNELHTRHHKERVSLHEAHEREMKDMHMRHAAEHNKAGMDEATAEAGGTTDAGVGAAAEA